MPLLHVSQGQLTPGLALLPCAVSPFSDAGGSQKLLGVGVVPGTKWLLCAALSFSLSCALTLLPLGCSPFVGVPVLAWVIPRTTLLRATNLSKTGPGKTLNQKKSFLLLLIHEHQRKTKVVSKQSNSRIPTVIIFFAFISGKLSKLFIH